MTDYQDVPDDPLDADDVAHANEVFVEMTITTAGGRSASDRYDLSTLFLSWAWQAGYRDWDEGVKAVARTLRGLERVGFIERRTIRRAGQPTHHGFVLTEEGRQALVAVSGDEIKGVR